MIIILSPQIIKDFRNQVNSNSYHALFVYKNKGGENLWNVICSSMDWIDVALGYFNYHKFDETNINIMSMEVYTYISSIDIIWESIKKLHKIILGVETNPFKGTDDVFANKYLQADDNHYFKHIRAAFGAHPVDLKNGRGEKEEKWAASWPTSGYDEDFDFSVILYDLDTNKDSITFGFKFAELDKFIEVRYEYIQYLKCKLEKDYADHCEKMRREIIENSDDIAMQLKILQVELKKRLDNQYFNDRIFKIIRLINTPLTNDENKSDVHVYLTLLEAVVDELKSKIQKMDFTNLESDWLIEPEYPSELRYYFSKVMDNLYSYSFQPIRSSNLRRISEFLKDYITICATMSKEEIFLLIHVGLYKYWKK